MCAGDGHTEAVKVEFDTSVISYEELVSRILKEASSHGYGGAQYQSAVWVQNEEQAAIAARVAASLKKEKVPILQKSAWHDAEGYHQKYMEKQRSYY